MLRRTLALTHAALELSFAYLTSRPASGLVTLLAFALSAVVFLGALAVRQSFAAAFSNVGSRNVAIIVARNENKAGESVLPASLVHAIRNLPGISGSDSARVTPEVVSFARVEHRSRGTPDVIVFRGITPDYFAMHPSVRLVQGRMYVPGLHQVIVGRQATTTFRHLAIGDHVAAAGEKWQVVGVFAAEGSVLESGLLTDVTDLQQALSFGPHYSSIAVRISASGGLAQLKEQMQAIPYADVTVLSERSYIRGQAAHTLNFMTTIGTWLTLIIVLAAVASSANLMRNSVQSRAAAIGVLRALGFPRGFVVASILVENAVLGLLGGAVGLILVFTLFRHQELSTMAFSGSPTSSYAVAFRINLPLYFIGYVVCLMLTAGIAGAIPGVRTALRMPVAEQIRRE